MVFIFYHMRAICISRQLTNSSEIQQTAGPSAEAVCCVCAVRRAVVPKLMLCGPGSVDGKQTKQLGSTHWTYSGQSTHCFTGQEGKGVTWLAAELKHQRPFFSGWIVGRSISVWLTKSGSLRWFGLTQTFVSDQGKPPLYKQYKTDERNILVMTCFYLCSK